MISQGTHLISNDEVFWPYRTASLSLVLGRAWRNSHHSHWPWVAVAPSGSERQQQTGNSVWLMAYAAIAPKTILTQAITHLTCFHSLYITTFTYLPTQEDKSISSDSSGLQA